jgi:hypothetical protein
MAACCYAQGDLSGGSGDPFTAFARQVTIVVLGIVGYVAVWVLFWNLLQSHHHGAGILVGVVQGIITVYALTHVQIIVGWISRIGNSGATL